MVLLIERKSGLWWTEIHSYVTQKIRDLRKMIEKTGKQIDIEVDGGVNLENLREIMTAGANIIVAGSAVFKGDPADVTAFLKIINGQLICFISAQYDYISCADLFIYTVI